jgi:alpha,alpha-trehalose phosphorylase
MRTGVLSRDLHWSTPSGKHVRVRSSRIVSLEHRHLVAMTYEVTLLDHRAPVAVSSQVFNRQDAGSTTSPTCATTTPGWRGRSGTACCNLVERSTAQGRMLLGYETANSRMKLGMGVDHVIESEDDYETSLRRRTTSRSSC